MLRKILERFSQKELEQYVEANPRIKIDVEGGRRSKRQLVTWIVRHLGDEVGSRLQAELDLYLVQCRQGSKKWKVMYLVENAMLGGLTHFGADDSVLLESMLNTELSLFYSQDTIVQFHEGAYWIRISINDGKAVPLRDTGRHSQEMYLLYFPGSQLIFSSSIPRLASKYIAQAIMNTFKASEIVSIPASSKDIPSLTQLVLDSHANAPLERYERRTQHSDILLDPREEMKGLPPRKKPRLHRESDAHLRDCLANEIARQFGTKHPTVGRVQCQITGPYKGEAGLVLDMDNFHCQVVLEGTDVVQGMKEMVAAGILVPPIPSGLAGVPTGAGATVRISSRDAQ